MNLVSKNSNSPSDIGFILVTHPGIGAEMLRVTEKILKEKSHILAVDYTFDQPPEDFKNNISAAIQSLKGKKGIIILTDMYGATPTNLCRDFYVNENVRLLTGFNLPMLLKASTASFHDSLENVIQYLKAYGAENIRTYP